MVPNKFNMIDLDGLDIIESQGVIVAGLYDKLVESIALCRYQCIYNWKFNSIPIPPTYVELDSKSDGVWINNGIVVSQDNTIHIYTLEPDHPVINPLNVVSNGVYNVSEGVDGFNPVSVQVPPPVIQPLTVDHNGVYEVTALVSGFNPVTVNVAKGLQAAVGELFRHIMFSNSASDKVQRSDRWFHRDTNEPVLFVSGAVLENGSIAYTGYAAISFSANGITGTNNQYGNLVEITQKVTPNGTSYYVQTMYGMYPTSTDSGRLRFMYASSNYEFILVPSLSSIVFNHVTKDFIGDQNLISLMYTLIDAMYQEYYS